MKKVYRYDFYLEDIYRGITTRPQQSKYLEVERTNLDPIEKAFSLPIGSASDYLHRNAALFPWLVGNIGEMKEMFSEEEINDPDDEATKRYIAAALLITKGYPFNKESLALLFQIPPEGTVLILESLGEKGFLISDQDESFGNQYVSMFSGNAFDFIGHEYCEDIDSNYLARIISGINA